MCDTAGWYFQLKRTGIAPRLADVSFHTLTERTHIRMGDVGACGQRAWIFLQVKNIHANSSCVWTGEPLVAVGVGWTLLMDPPACRSQDIILVQRQPREEN